MNVLLHILIVFIAIAIAIVAVLSLVTYDHIYFIFLRKTRLTKLIARVESGNEKALDHLLQLTFREHYPLYGDERDQKQFVYFFANWLAAKKRRETLALRAAQLGKDLKALARDEKNRRDQEMVRYETRKLEKQLIELKGKAAAAKTVPKKIAAQLYLIAFWNQRLVGAMEQRAIAELQAREGFQKDQLIAEITAAWGEYCESNVRLAQTPSSAGLAAFKEVRAARILLQQTSVKCDARITFAWPKGWGEIAANYLPNPTVADLNLHPDADPGSVRLLAAKVLNSQNPAIFDAKRVLAYVNASDRCRAEVGEMASQIARIVERRNAELQSEIKKEA